MPSFLSYTNLLLIALAAILGLTVLYLVRRFRRPAGGELQEVLREEPRTRAESYHDLVAPLMLYEDHYPAFGAVLALVLKEFPLERFLQRDQDFRRAITYLSRKVYDDSQDAAIVTAMCMVVQTFVSDPDVEYRCRPRFQECVDRFLEEISG